MKTNRITGTLHEDQCTFFVISRSFLLRMRNVSNNNTNNTNAVQNIKTHILCSVTFFFENRTVYGKKWKNIVERGRPQMKIRCMRIACWIFKSTNTPS